MKLSLDWLLSMFKSKKFVVTVLGFLVPILNKTFGWGLGMEEILGILGAVGLFSVGQGIADAGSKGATSGTTPEVAIQTPVKDDMIMNTKVESKK